MWWLCIAVHFVATSEQTAFDALAALQANLHGVLPVHKGTFGSLQQSGLQWGNRLKQMFAACHSLNMVSRSAVAGADMERSLFKAVEASFLVGICLCILGLPHLFQTRPKVRRQQKQYTKELWKINGYIY